MCVDLEGTTFNMRVKDCSDCVDATTDCTLIYLALTVIALFMGNRISKITDYFFRRGQYRHHGEVRPRGVWLLPLGDMFYLLSDIILFAVYSYVLYNRTFCKKCKVLMADADIIVRDVYI